MAAFRMCAARGQLTSRFHAFRMLARYFDLPFRKDVLRRILQEQLSRAGDDGLGLQLAAVCDLMGLTGSILEVSEFQLSRLELPALILQDGHPQVLWEMGDVDCLIGDPRTEQRRCELDSFVGYSEEGTLPVLTIQRSATSPTNRFGLGWFLPALMQHRTILVQVLLASFLCSCLDCSTRC